MLIYKFICNLISIVVFLVRRIEVVVEIYKYTYETLLVIGGKFYNINVNILTCVHSIALNTMLQRKPVIHNSK